MKILKPIETFEIIDFKKPTKYKKIPIINDFINWLEINNNGNIYKKKIVALQFCHLILDGNPSKNLDFNISDLTDEHINSYFNFLNMRIEIGEINEKTYNVTIMSFNTFIAFLKENNLIDVNYSQVLNYV